jgi:hypothetical protein
LEVVVGEGGHGARDLLDERLDHALVQVVSQHLVLQGGEDREDHPVHPRHLLLRGQLLPCLLLQPALREVEDLPLVRVGAEVLLDLLCRGSECKRGPYR